MSSSSKTGHKINPSLITDEQTFLNRRTLLKGMGMGLIAPYLAPAGLLANKTDPAPATAERLLLSYNNYYEFSTDKAEVSRLCQGVTLGPWAIQIDGMVEKPLTVDSSTLTKKFQLFDRTYRFRCVEAWSAVVPWQGFQLSELIKLARPLNKAKYIQFLAEADTKKMPGLSSHNFPWPYSEGLRLDEALHPLTLIATGMYGKPLATQSGAPLRLVVPWKYGFKSIKAIKAIRFTDVQPSTLWNKVGPKEYGFYANVNPEVDHPRWSQSTEKVLGSCFNRQKTQMFNGYQDEVASLYKGMDLKKWY